MAFEGFEERDKDRFGIEKLEGSVEQIVFCNEDNGYTVCDMALDRTGALIVVERYTNLDSFIKSGVEINAGVKSYLLKNIFFNKAPLHDGAVIIRNMQIIAAGCFLPLSTNPDIVKDLGTRHRSAIGMSENSDAVVIVVSEETGTISVAQDGVLMRNFDYGKLQKVLTEAMVTHGEKSGKPTVSAFFRKLGAMMTKKNDKEEGDGQ